MLAYSAVVNSPVGSLDISILLQRAGLNVVNTNALFKVPAGDFITDKLWTIVPKALRGTGSHTRYLPAYRAFLVID